MPPRSVKHSSAYAVISMLMVLGTWLHGFFDQSSGSSRSHHFLSPFDLLRLSRTAQA